MFGHGSAIPKREGKGIGREGEGEAKAEGNGKGKGRELRLMGFNDDYSDIKKLTLSLLVETRGFEKGQLRISTLRRP